MQEKGLIFAADIQEKKSLIDIVEQVSDFVDYIKIGNTALLEFGWDIVKVVKFHSAKPVLVDLKLMDIPYIASGIVSRALSSGADGILVCGPSGYETLSICNKIFSPKEVYVLTQFTHMSGLISDEMADDYVQLALSLNCTGVQVPATIPNRISKIRNCVGDKLKIISCGVGEQGPDIGSAISAGADFEIIGRFIYNSKSLTPYEAANFARSRLNDAIKKSDLDGEPNNVNDIGDGFELLSLDGNQNNYLN